MSKNDYAYDFLDFITIFTSKEKEYANNLQSILIGFVASRKDLPFDKLIEIVKCRSKAAKKLANLKNDIPDSENLWKFCNIYSKAAVDEDKAMCEIRGQLRKIIENERAQAAADKKSDKSAGAVKKTHFPSRKVKDKANMEDDKEQFDTISEEPRKNRSFMRMLKDNFGGGKRDGTPTKETRDKDSRRVKNNNEQWTTEDQTLERQNSKPNEQPKSISIRTDINVPIEHVNPADSPLKRQQRISTGGKQAAPPAPTEPSTAASNGNASERAVTTQQVTVQRPSPPDKIAKSKIQEEAAPKTPVYVNLIGPTPPSRNRKAVDALNEHLKAESLEGNAKKGEIQPTLITIETSGHARYRETSPQTSSSRGVLAEKHSIEIRSGEEQKTNRAVSNGTLKNHGKPDDDMTKKRHGQAHIVHVSDGNKGEFHRL